MTKVKERECCLFLEYDKENQHRKTRHKETKLYCRIGVHNLKDIKYINDTCGKCRIWEKRY